MNARTYLVSLFACVSAFALLYATAYTALEGAPVRAEYWLHGARLVKQRLAERSPPPRTLFFGGSSTLFGIDAAAIQHGTGRPAYNLGLHAGLPLSYHLDYARQLMRRGDEVVVVPEYGYFRQTVDNTTWFIDQVLAWDGDWLNRGGLETRLNMMLSTPLRSTLNAAAAKLYARRILARMPERAIPSEEDVMRVFEAGWASTQANPPARRAFQYFHNNFDDHGGILNTIGSDGPAPQDYGMTGEAPAGDAAWRRLAAFAKECRLAGVTLYLGFAPMMDSAEVAAHRERVLANLAAVKARGAALGIEFIEQPGDALQAPENFFDTNFHLNDEGKRVRAARLVAALAERAGR